ncbi:MAG TPA: LysR family transcriptional regulator [Bradyrhizobium sp.]
MNVDLRQLRAFVTVVQVGSFSRAARSLGMSQSALSQAVRQLEDELRVRLLDRTTRSVQLSKVGGISCPAFSACWPISIINCRTCVICASIAAAT